MKTVRVAQSRFVFECYRLEKHTGLQTNVSAAVLDPKHARKQKKRLFKVKLSIIFIIDQSDFLIKC